jgi:hypothetical protein
MVIECREVGFGEGTKEEDINKRLWEELIA